MCSQERENKAPLHLPLNWCHLVVHEYSTGWLRGSVSTLKIATFLVGEPWVDVHMNFDCRLWRSGPYHGLL
jgi:hypothetical protein